MKKIAIRLLNGNHEFKEKSLKLVTIFGDVYAPLSVTKIVDNIAFVPEWVFYKNGKNPCQMVKGFEEGLQEDYTGY